MDANGLPQHGRGPDNQVGLDKQVKLTTFIIKTNSCTMMQLFVLMIKVVSFNVV